jgi:hypothetical protein
MTGLVRHLVARWQPPGADSRSTFVESSGANEAVGVSKSSGAKSFGVSKSDGAKSSG